LDERSRRGVVHERADQGVTRDGDGGLLVAGGRVSWGAGFAVAS
jgi:hypothetical protein